MEHSPEESEQFQALAEAFDIYNPRKLLRLRNSYRLLKLFDLQRAIRSAEHERFDPALLMACLFWQEFLFACRPTVRQACEEAVHTPAKSKKVPDAAAARVVERFVTRLGENPEWRDRLENAGSFVGRVVLPRGDN